MEPVKDIPKFRRELIKEYNRVRTAPKEYAEVIRKYKDNFKDLTFIIPETNFGIKTEEGPKGFEEAENFLESTNPVNKLKYNAGLAHIANDMLIEIQKKDLNFVESMDIYQLFDKYGTASGSFARTIDFGSRDAKIAIVLLLVNDGKKDKQKADQRNAIFSKDIKEIGIASGEVKDYGQCTVIVTMTKFIINKDVKDEFHDGEGDDEEETEKKGGEGEGEEEEEGEGEGEGEREGEREGEGENDEE